MISLSGKICMITGASSGIGKAVTKALAGESCNLYLLSRNKENLDNLAEEIRGSAASVITVGLDLRDVSSIAHFTQDYIQKVGKLDVLIHCAAAYEADPLQFSEVETYDLLFETNVRAPLVLTKALIPCFNQLPGQIVCLNSSSGIRPNIQAGVFSASKHAFKVLADVLRAEVNDLGIRVLSIYPGRTNTPLAKQIFEKEGKAYDPLKLLQPEDIASTIVHSLKLPATAEITDIHIRPFFKTY